MSFWKKLRKKKTLTIKICPKCEKPSLYRARNLGWTITELYRCRECNYEGAFYLEIEPNETGENFANLEKLKKTFPDDVDPETEINLDEESLKNVLKSKKSNSD